MHVYLLYINYATKVFCMNTRVDKQNVNYKTKSSESETHLKWQEIHDRECTRSERK